MAKTAKSYFLYLRIYTCKKISLSRKSNNFKTSTHVTVPESDMTQFK